MGRKKKNVGHAWREVHAINTRNKTISVTGTVVRNKNIITYARAQ